MRRPYSVSIDWRSASLARAKLKPTTVVAATTTATTAAAVAAAEAGRSDTTAGST